MKQILLSKNFFFKTETLNLFQQIKFPELISNFFKILNRYISLTFYLETVITLVTSLNFIFDMQK